MIREGGDSGAVIEPGDADASELIRRVSSEDTDERMPPESEGSPLDEKQVALLRAWIDQGAPAPDEPIPPDPRKHWAYPPPVKPEIPRVNHANWARNPLDRFIGVQHSAHGLTPVPGASPEVLIRRIYLDLIGLPPTRQQLRDYLKDPSPVAYERVVDRLLSSPQHGERWGRHWMDIWRYSDWAGSGGEVRHSQRHIWRWRDWIVESLNHDKGYDRFILEMLAADELSPVDRQALRATGFLTRNYYFVDRNRWLDDVIDHTGRAFLGVTMRCARCHDHKYDPISLTEYYRMRAIFEPYGVRIDRVRGELDINKDGLARIYDAWPEAPTYEFVRGNPKHADTDTKLEPAVPSVLGGRLQIESGPVMSTNYYPAIRPFVTDQMIAEAERAIDSARADLESEKQKQKARNLTVDERSLEYKLSRESVELAEKKLKSASADLIAMEARLAADLAKYPPDRDDAGSGPADAALQQTLVQKAADVQRRAHMAHAEEKLLASIVQLGGLRLDVNRKQREYDE